MAFTTLAHHIDYEWLLEAHRRTRKDRAVGVDRQTAQQCAETLEETLRSLQQFFWEGVAAWHKWLSRRSRAARRKCTWAWMVRMLQRWPLPPPRIVHRYGLQLKLPQAGVPGHP